MSDEIVIGAHGEEGRSAPVGRDGGAGYLNAEQKEALVESDSDLAPYRDLKFKTPAKPKEASKEVEALAHTSSALASAGKEIERLRQERDERDLADGVAYLLDRAEEVADTLEWGEADEVRRDAQLQAMSAAAAIEDEELRQATFARLEERVDPDLYDAVVEDWQRRYADQTERDIEEGLAHAQSQHERELKTFAQVVQMEDDLLNQLSPLEQACAVKLLDAPGTRDEIAQMDPGMAQEAIRAHMELGRVVAHKMEEARTQEEIIKAHGRTKGGLNGRALREQSMYALGILPDLFPTEEEVEEAYHRSQRAVKNDRKKAVRIHRGTGATGAEKMMAQQIALAKRMGVPVHDGATGRRLDT